MGRMRISIIGNCASGKSVLAQKMSERHHIPHLHLDRLWFEAKGNEFRKGDTEGRERVQAYIRQKVEAFIMQDSWVADGWYSRVQPLIAERANQIVFLDIPLWRRVWNHLYRVFFTERHQELSKWDDLKFTYQIVRRTFTQGRGMKKFVRENPEKVVVLRTYKEVGEWEGRK